MSKRPLEERIKKIRQYYIALKADVATLPTMPKEQRDEKVEELRKDEEKTINLAKKDFDEGLSLKAEWDDLISFYAEVFGLSREKALHFVLYRELKNIHWHLDQVK